MDRERVRLKGPDDVLLLALIDLHTLNFPICVDKVSKLSKNGFQGGNGRKGKKGSRRTCFGKRSAILLHELIARWDTRYLRAALVLAWNTSSGPHSASPITAKGSV
jgi:hypothetical protein